MGVWLFEKEAEYNIVRPRELKEPILEPSMLKECVN